MVENLDDVYFFGKKQSWRVNLNEKKVDKINHSRTMVHSLVQKISKDKNSKLVAKMGDNSTCAIGLFDLDLNKID